MDSTALLTTSRPSVVSFRCQLVQNNTLSAAELKLPAALRDRDEPLPKHFFQLTIELSGGAGGGPPPTHVSLIPEASQLSLTSKHRNLVRFAVDVNRESFFASLPSCDPTSGYYADLTIPLPMSVANKILCDLYDIDESDPEAYVEIQRSTILESLKDIPLGEDDVMDIISAFSKRMPRNNRGSRPKRNVFPLGSGTFQPPSLWPNHASQCNHHGVDCECEILLKRTACQMGRCGWASTYSAIVACSSLTKQLAGLQKNVLGRSIRNSKVFSQQVLTQISWSLPGSTMVSSAPMCTGSDLYEVLPPKREAIKRKRKDTMAQLSAVKKRASELEAENARLKSLAQCLMGANTSSFETELRRVLDGGPKPTSVVFRRGQAIVQGCNLGASADPVTVSAQLCCAVEPVLAMNAHKPFAFAIEFDARLHPDAMVPLKATRTSTTMSALSTTVDVLCVQLPSWGQLPDHWVRKTAAMLGSGASVQVQLVFHRGSQGYLDPAHKFVVANTDSLDMSDEELSHHMASVSSTDCTSSSGDEEVLLDDVMSMDTSVSNHRHHHHHADSKTMVQRVGPLEQQDGPSFTASAEAALFSTSADGSLGAPLFTGSGAGSLFTGSSDGAGIFGESAMDEVPSSIVAPSPAESLFAIAAAAGAW